METIVKHRSATRMIFSAMAILAVAYGSGCSGNQAGTPDTADGNDGGIDSSLPWLTARRGKSPGIFDSLGRQVLLRGANFNHLGDYFQASPYLPTVDPLEPDDFDKAAATGMNVIRLVTSWSFWQPERGGFDVKYLARVRAAAVGA